MKIKNSYIYLASLSAIFLCLISLTTIFLSLSQYDNTDAMKETEIVYVYIEESLSETESQGAQFFIKEQNEKIGVFDSHGKLLNIIDTHVKTLPEAEQAAIKKGFEVNSEAELYSIIEAYTD